MKYFLIAVILTVSITLVFANRAVGYDVSGAITVNTLQMPENLETEIIGSNISLTWTGVYLTRAIRESYSRIKSESGICLSSFEFNPHSIEKFQNRKAVFNDRLAISATKEENLNPRQYHEFIGYNVYRDGLVLNDDPLVESFYYDNDTVLGNTYEYFVTAVYDVAESFATNTVVVELAGIIYGDINRDGVVTPLDAAIILQYYVGYDPIPDIDPIPWTDESLQIADVDLDGQILPLDAAIILQYYVGLIDSLPIQPDRNKRDSVATVDVLYESGFLNIYPDSKVIGLGVEFSPEYIDYLGEPIFKSSCWLSAFKATDFIYKIALAQTENTAKATGRNNLILSIPVLSENIEQIELFLDVNNQERKRVVINILETDSELLHTKTFLKSNYPNPFNPKTNIEFSLEEDGYVVVEVFNLKGQKIRTLFNETKKAGMHSVVWNGRDNYDRKVGSGIFFYRMKTDNYNEIRKMILLK